MGLPENILASPFGPTFVERPIVASWAPSGHDYLPVKPNAPKPSPFASFLSIIPRGLNTKVKMGIGKLSSDKIFTFFFFFSFLRDKNVQRSKTPQTYNLWIELCNKKREKKIHYCLKTAAISQHKLYRHWNAAINLVRNLFSPLVRWLKNFPMYYSVKLKSVT